MFIYNHFSYYTMASPSSKALPYITLLATIAVLAVPIFTDTEITDQHVQIIGAMLGTLGLGGVYNGVRKGFTQAKSIQATAGYDEIAEKIKQKLKDEKII